LRIAITADPYIPVPPEQYGGIERVIDFVVRGLVQRGHDVTLFAHPDSKVPVRLIPYGVPPHWGIGPRGRELWQVGGALLQRSCQFDAVHSFGRLAALLPVLPVRKLAKIQSYQRPCIPSRSVRTAVLLAGQSIAFTACATWMYNNRNGKGTPRGAWHTVFNGVPMARYDFVAHSPDDAPLVFLGRLERIKGAHGAIAIARQSGRQLVIAGNQVQSGPDADYFEKEIAPALDGQIRYIGAVNDAQKNRLLGSAAALLMPVEWDEPFGIVMAEALACGTPVIGFGRGSVLEVVVNGLNGFICHDLASAVDCVTRIGQIDRAAVRADCERRFADSVIVAQYEALYEKLVQR